MAPFSTHIRYLFFPDLVCFGENNGLESVTRLSAIATERPSRL